MSEKLGLIFVSITLLGGLIGEILINYGKVILPMENIETISMNLLQIQAGISSLTVALIALITGLISVEYYGISITRYYLILKPRDVGACHRKCNVSRL